MTSLLKKTVDGNQEGQMFVTLPKMNVTVNPQCLNSFLPGAWNTHTQKPWQSYLLSWHPSLHEAIKRTRANPEKSTAVKKAQCKGQRDQVQTLHQIK